MNIAYLAQCRGNKHKKNTFEDYFTEYNFQNRGGGGLFGDIFFAHNS